MATTTMVRVFEQRAFDVPKVFLVRPAPPVSKRPAPRDNVQAVMDMIELRDHMRGGPEARARAELRQEGRTKRTAFLLFVLMSAALVFMLWAGVRG
jgi:hypothetical protein